MQVYMYKSIPTFILFVISCFSMAQSPYAKKYMGVSAYLNQIEILPDSKILVGGIDSVLVLMKVNPIDGSVIWQKNGLLEGSYEMTDFNSMQYTQTGKIIIAGMYNSTSFSGTGGAHQSFYSLVDTSGTNIWQLRSDDVFNTSGPSIVEISKGKYMSLFIEKDISLNYHTKGCVINELGSIIPKKEIFYSNNNKITILSNPHKSIDGNVIATGNANQLDRIRYQTDGLFAKFDTAFNPIWCRLFSDTLTNSIIQSISLSDLGYMLLSPHKSDGVVIMKTDANGKLKWAKYYKDTIRKSWTYIIPSDIVSTNDGSYIVSGRFINSFTNNPGWMMKIDSVGKVLWSFKIDEGANAVHYDINKIKMMNNNDVFFAGSIYGHYSSTFSWPCFMHHLFVKSDDITASIKDTGITLTTQSFIKDFSTDDIVLNKIQEVHPFVCNESSIPEFSNLIYNIYPNPSSQFVTINFNPNLPIQNLKLINLMGTIVYYKLNVGNSETISLTDYSPGVYYLELNSGNQKCFKKILIAH